MTRVEKQADVKKQLEDVKGEVVKQVKQSTRKRKPWMACGLLLVAAIAGLFLWIGWVIASTGLVTIPLLSTLAFKDPEPTRVVEPGVSAEVYMEEWFTTLLTTRLVQGGGVIQDKGFSLTLPEESLTSSMRNLLAESQMEMIQHEQVQVLIEPDQVMELFVPLEVNGKRTAATLMITLGATDGATSVQLNEIQIGSYRLPKFVIAAFLTPTIERELQDVNARLSGYVDITTLSTQQGDLLLEGELIAEVESPL
jgi:hypothetical protein